MDSEVIKKQSNDFFHAICIKTSFELLIVQRSQVSLVDSLW